MKKLLFIAMLLAVNTAIARGIIDSSNFDPMKHARTLLKPNTLLYNPTEAFKYFLQCAQKDNAEAMNAVGMMYAKGLGTSKNEQESLKWLKKASKKNYPNAWYNLGVMYKTGDGVDQDFEKAYNCFEKGSVLNSAKAFYGQGFLLYKGLGCPQDYSKAKSLFLKGASLHELGSMYMLGLCYRNGYGTAVNIDSAKYYLLAASKGGYKLANDELSSPIAENSNLNTVVADVSKAIPNGQAIDVKNGYHDIKHNISKASISGEYAGTIIKFDWSGKHIINQSPVKVALTLKNQILKGKWLEDNNALTNIEADQTDSALIFHNTKYSREDHYNIHSPNEFDFKNAHFVINKIKDTVLLVGTLKLYSTKLKEPEKPTVVMLMRIGKDPVKPTFENDSLKADSVHFVAFPNPFSAFLNVHYTIKHACSVRLVVTDVLTGRVAYMEDSRKVEPGDYTNKVEFNGPSGNYIVTLEYGNKLKSALIFKQ